MIPRLRRRLIQNIRRRPAQLRPLTLKPQIANPRDILLAVAEIVHEEQRQRVHAVEERAPHGDLLQVGRLREFQLLYGLELFGGGEVQGVPVGEEAEGFGGAGGGGGAEEDGVEFDLGSKPSILSIQCSWLCGKVGVEVLTGGS